MSDTSSELGSSIDLQDSQNKQPTQNDQVDTFITKMNGWLGEGSARHYAISDKGAYAAWL